jgi:hypothetical protein
MTTPRDPDQILATWLDEGPTTLPPSTYRAILVATRTFQQQRLPRWAPWRTSMLSFTRVALAATVFLIVGLSGLTLVSPSLDPGSDPSGPAIDTSAWTPYVSDRYGFSIGHPAGWTELPADHTWTLGADHDWLSSAPENFRAPDSTIRVSAWSVPIEPGTTAETWIQTYCPYLHQTCTDLQDRTVPVTMDGHPGSLVQYAEDTQAFIQVDDRMYVVAAWQPETDPSTVRFGGATRLLEGYLSTMHLLPSGPAIDTSAWTPYVSDRYGFSIGHPAGWTELPADHTWTLGADKADPSSGAVDRLIAPDGDIQVGAWSVALGLGTPAHLDGTDIEAWVEAYCQVTGMAPCTGIAERAVPLCLERRDCHPGLLVPFDDSVQAFFSGGNYDTDKMIVVATWNGVPAAAVEPNSGSRQLLEAILSTMSVWPESAPLDERTVPDLPAGSQS